MKKVSSDLLLLDVNVLLAIAWPDHQFHATAIAALSRRGEPLGRVAAVSDFAGRTPS